MTSIEDVRSGRLVYTCNCGWLDTWHMDPTEYRPTLGAESIWRQIKCEQGIASVRTDVKGFKVTYRQDVLKHVANIISVREYFVKYGLSTREKESVALAIFMNISMDFEAAQGKFPFYFASDSSFSVEDLVSNLIGFYKAVRPGTKYLDLCKPVHRVFAEQVWRNSGPVGSFKNTHFRPRFFPCRGCPRPVKFPPQLQAIQPAKTSPSFRPWIRIVVPYKSPDRTADEIVVQPPLY